MNISMQIEPKISQDDDSMDEWVDDGVESTKQNNDVEENKD